MKKIAVLLVIAVLLTMQSAHAAMKFDFGPADVTPAAGFTRVTHETVYSSAQGYGIDHYRSEYTPNARSVVRGSVEPYVELRTFVDMSFGQRFQVDVPNGDYYVTVVAGDPEYTYYERLYINGTTYSWATSGVTPAGAPVKLLQHTGWTTDLEKIAFPNSAWRDAGSNNVRVLGYNTQSYVDEDSKNIEYVMLDQAEITVTDGKICVENQWGTGNKLNYVIIEPVPEPATALLLMVGCGSIFAKRKH